MADLHEQAVHVYSTSSACKEKKKREREKEREREKGGSASGMLRNSFYHANMLVPLSLPCRTRVGMMFFSHTSMLYSKRGTGFGNKKYMSTRHKLVKRVHAA